MSDLNKDRAAEEVERHRTVFDLALSNKRSYPLQEFRALVRTTRRYIQMTEHDALIHKSVARAVNGL